MSTREFDVSQTVQAIRAGKSDLELMETFHLSALELLRLIRKLADAGALKKTEIQERAQALRQGESAPKARNVPAQRIMQDVKAGVHDMELMRAYGFSAARELQVVFKKLIEAGLLTSDDLERRAVALHGTASTPPESEQRNCVLFSLPVYDVDDLETEGFVNEISPAELQISGIASDVGTQRSFLIRPDEFADIYPFVVDVQCRWINSQDRQGDHLALYQITDVSEKGREELDKLIQLLSFDEA